MINLDIVLYTLLISFMMFFAGSILYSTIKIGIPPMPSSNKAYKAMMQLVDETEMGEIVDLGSGWGNLVIRLAKSHPQRQVVGYEVSMLPWITSSLLKKVLGLKNLTLHRKNFYQADLSNTSVLVCYLFPEAMEKISAKLQKEQSNIGYLISNNFTLPSNQPSKTIQLNDFYRSSIYLYNLKK